MAESVRRLYNSSVIRAVSCVLIVLAVAGVAALQDLPPESPRPAPVPAPAPPPTPINVPASGLFDWDRDTKYLGAFRIPQTPIAGTDLQFNGTGLAFNDANQSLFIVGRDLDGSATLDGQPVGQRVAEIAVPDPVIADTVDELPIASILQAPLEPTEGLVAQAAVGNTPMKIGGLLVWKGRLYISEYGYYDGANLQTLTHFSRPLSLTKRRDVRGPYGLQSAAVPPPLGARMYSGWMAIVPNSLRDALGGDVVVGQCCLAIVSTISNGPSAFGWNPDQFGPNQNVVADFFYTPDYPLGNGWAAQSPYWNGTTKIGGSTFVRGTRSLLFFGSHGTGPFCYGSGDTCNDPVYPPQGTHAPPYVYQIWAYDATDLQMAVNGQRTPWSVVPYAIWNPTFPFEPVQHQRAINGVAYDPVTGRIFVEQILADPPFNSVIHVFQGP